MKMKKIDLIKENATYKLVLIALLDSFEEARKNVSNRELKRYFSDLISIVNDTLDSKEEIKISFPESLGEENE